jgi:hypothetical protein
MAEIYGMQKKYVKLILFFLISIIIFFIGLRYRTGADFNGYLIIFDDPLKEYTAVIPKEPGYVILNRIFKYIFGNYYILQCSITFFVCFSVYKFIVRYSKYPLVSLFLFIIFFFDDILMAQMRQSIALGIVLLSTKYIFNRKIIPFLFMVVLACMFHISAICAIPLYFLTWYFNKIISAIAMLASLIFYYKNNILILILSLIAPLLPGRLSEIAIKYLNSELYAGQTQGLNTGIYYIANLLLAMFLVLTIKPKDNKMIFFINTIIIAAIITNVSTGLVIIQRLRAYYLVYGIIGYTYIFKSINFRKLRDLFVIYACCIVVFFAIPFVKARTNYKISIITGRHMQYYWIPYYNAVYHSEKADYR